jgi:hypothetical protein
MDLHTLYAHTSTTLMSNMRVIENLREPDSDSGVAGPRRNSERPLNVFDTQRSALQS